MDKEEITNRLRKDLKQLKSSVGYLNAGYPRYKTLFGRDSIISAWQMIQIDPSIAKATLLILSEFQGQEFDQQSEEEPGKILHEYRYDPKEQAKLPDWKFPYYGSIDSTPLYLILAAEYLKVTNDFELIAKIWKNILAALNWLFLFGDKDQDGYIEYQRINPMGLFHQGWRDSSEDTLQINPPIAIVEAQGYLYAAYHSVDYILKRYNENHDLSSKRIKNRAKLLKRKFNQDFWMEQETYFALALDNMKIQKKVVSSNPGHLLFTGIIDKNKIDFLVNRLFQPDMWTEYGIRTYSVNAPDYNPYSYHMGSIWPHDNWIIYKGLQKSNYIQKAAKIKHALLSAYRELNKIPEYYFVIDKKIQDPSARINGRHHVSANPIQAWASAGLLEMLVI